MTDKYIVSKLLGAWIFNIESYIIPRKIISKKNKTLNLYQIRKKYLEESKDNPNVRVLLDFMKEEYPDTKYIQEFPILINKFFLNYRCLDIFLPKYGIGIELDSHYHDYSKNNDTRSDLFTYKEYGIKIIRLRLIERKEDDLNILRKLFHIQKPLEFNFPIDYSNIISSEFKRIYRKEIKLLEEIENQYSWGLYNDNLILTTEQENILKPILKILEVKYNII